MSSLLRKHYARKAELKQQFRNSWMGSEELFVQDINNSMEQWELTADGEAFVIANADDTVDWYVNVEALAAWAMDRNLVTRKAS